MQSESLQVALAAILVRGQHKKKNNNNFVLNTPFTVANSCIYLAMQKSGGAGPPILKKWRGARPPCPPCSYPPDAETT